MRYLSEMPVGTQAYVVPWVISIDSEGNAYLMVKGVNTVIHTATEPSGTFTVLVYRTPEGYEIERLPKDVYQWSKLHELAQALSGINPAKNPDIYVKITVRKSKSRWKEWLRSQL